MPTPTQLDDPGAPPEPILEVRGLHKSFGPHDVLRGIFRERLRTVVNILPYNVNSTTQSIAGVNMC